MLFEIMEGAACAINEYQIVVSGGVNSNRKNSDILQIYNIRENQWRLFEICLSTPRRQVTMVSSQKDRVMILGGLESDGSESRIVEEIDFIKRNIVTLPLLKYGRAAPSAFQVNDTIYVFGGTGALSVINKDLTTTSDPSLEIVIGEKFVLRENKWREVVSRSKCSSAALGTMQMLMEPGT